jgi:prepilin-type N-terminal cleavage/methylation domain-containing protein
MNRSRKLMWRSYLMSLYNVRKSNSGFTLVELLITLIIIGVIAVISVPNFLGLLNRNRVNEAAQQVEGAIKEAQRQAMRKGKICQIRFTSTGTGGNQRSIVKVSPDVGPVSYSGCLLNNRELPSSVSFGLLSGATVLPVNSSNEIDLAFSNKGNPNVQGMMVISHPKVISQKCIQIEGVLGNILSGDYNTQTKKCKAK